MAMSNEHKAALAQGRKESKAIKSYLEALATRRPGRPLTSDGLNKRMEKVNEKLESSHDPLEKVKLIQSKLDIEKALADLGTTQDLALLERGFVENASAYSERKGVSYTAWREIGVPAAVLREAGIQERRRR